jgi:hypothetical protein
MNTEDDPTADLKAVTPEPGDMLCIRYGTYEWGFAGDRFHSIEGEQVTSVHRFAKGEVRYSKLNKDHFRILRGTQLFRITSPPTKKTCETL